MPIRSDSALVTVALKAYKIEKVLTCEGHAFAPMCVGRGFISDGSFLDAPAKVCCLEEFGAFIEKCPLVGVERFCHDVLCPALGQRRRRSRTCKTELKGSAQSSKKLGCEKDALDAPWQAKAVPAASSTAGRACWLPDQ